MSFGSLAGCRTSGLPDGREGGQPENPTESQSPVLKPLSSHHLHIRLCFEKLCSAISFGIRNTESKHKQSNNDDWIQRALSDERNTLPPRQPSLHADHKCTLLLLIKSRDDFLGLVSSFTSRRSRVYQSHLGKLRGEQILWGCPCRGDRGNNILWERSEIHPHTYQISLFGYFGGCQLPTR